MTSDAEAETPEWAEHLREWRQGDYTLDIAHVVVVREIEGGEMVPSAGDAVGLAVISQTCDIVNWGPGKEWVVVAPLVEIDAARLVNALRGTTPAFALLESPPAENVLVDLGQSTTIHKSVLATLGRKVGLTSDSGRIRFANAITRKYGRFAFPDAFAGGVLAGLRSRISKSHGKESEQGKTYASIASIRAAAAPSWDSDDISVGFRFILDTPSRRLVDRQIMTKVLKDLMDKIEWPKGYRPEDPPFTLMSVDEMTAGQWLDSQEVDLDFISVSRPAD